MRAYLFAFLAAFLVLSFLAEAMPDCPNVCTFRKRARRQCRRRRQNCKLVRCGRRRRACVPQIDLAESPSPSSSSDPMVTPISSATASPTVSISPSSSTSPAPSLSPSVSPTPSISTTPSMSTTPSFSPTPSLTPSISSTPSSTPSPSPTPIVNTLSDVRGVSCPSGTSPGAFGGDSCDLTSLRVILAVGPSSNFGFPPRSNCPSSSVAGSGKAGCTLCGDDTSNTVRELVLSVHNNDAGCSYGTQLTERIAEYVKFTAMADGVELCQRDFDVGDGGTYITETLASKFQDIMNRALCSPDIGAITTLSDLSGVTCSSPGPYGGDNCDLTSLNVLLTVAPSNIFRFPSKSNCPDNTVAGGGKSGCTLCGDDSSNIVRELFLLVSHNDAGCTLGQDLTRRIYESIEAMATADGVDLCPRDFANDDGGPYISVLLPSRFQDVMNDALCV